MTKCLSVSRQVKKKILGGLLFSLPLFFSIKSAQFQFTLEYRSFQKILCVKDQDIL